jgi:hypothetical protein
MNQKELHIKFSAEDYVRVLTFIKSQNFIYKYAVVIIPSVVFVCFVLSIIQMANDVAAIEIEKMILVSLIPAAIVSAFIYLATKFVSPFFLKRAITKQCKSSPLMLEEQSVVFADEGIEFSSSLSSSKIKWDAIVKAIESNTDFLFYIGSKTAYFIPKETIGSEIDIIWLRGFSRAKLGDKAKF